MSINELSRTSPTVGPLSNSSEIVKTSSHQVEEQEKEAVDDKIYRLCTFLIQNAKNRQAAESASKCKENKDTAFLKEIISLDLSSSHFDSLPEEIYLLENVKYLDLCNNSLSSLPDTMELMKKLVTLNLDGNAFKKMPEQLERMPQLQCLHIFNNPMPNIPISYKNRIVALPYGARWSEN